MNLYLPFQEFLMITRVTLVFDGITVLLRDRKSVVLNIWYIKFHCKSMSQHQTASIWSVISLGHILLIFFELQGHRGKVC